VALLSKLEGLNNILKLVLLVQQLVLLQLVLLQLVLHLAFSGTTLPKATLADRTT
jgi:hypothetical protein